MTTDYYLLDDRYQVHERIATGGQGEVWRGVDQILGRPVAIKMLSAAHAQDNEYRARFRAEARYASSLAHPGITRVFDYGEHSPLGGPYLVMELVDGQPLAAILERYGRLDPYVVLDVLAQAARALDAAHRAGIVHRDIKPGNLLIMPDGTTKITDFGIAKANGNQRLTPPGMVMGAAVYVSPEQATGQPLTGASDVYSLGVAAYECLAGDPPFNAGQPLDTAAMHVHDPVPPLPADVPRPVADLVYAMLAKEPGDRPESAREVADRAEVILEARRRPAHAGPDTSGQPAVTGWPPAPPLTTSGPYQPAGQEDVPARGGLVKMIRARRPKPAERVADRAEPAAEDRGLQGRGPVAPGLTAPAAGAAPGKSLAGAHPEPAHSPRGYGPATDDVAVIEVAIRHGRRPGTFEVEIVSSPAGEATAAVTLDVDDLLARRERLQWAVLASAVARRRILPETERPVVEIGKLLFRALLGTGEVAGRYRAAAAVAADRGQRLRVLLRIDDPTLAALPWEAMYDEAAGAYVCRQDQLVRHLGVASMPLPLAVRAPLRILGIVASPRGLPALDTEREQEHLVRALDRPVRQGLVELHWVPAATWSQVHGTLLEGPWHVVHFIGHGDFDPARDEGFLSLVGEDGRSHRVPAHRMVDLLREGNPTPRLVVLNSCLGAQASTSDLFSGTAAALVRGGISAVAAMQYEISDAAAAEFARGFYTAIANGRGLDKAVSSGRVAILGTSDHTLEWLTPVLYLRGRETNLFDVQ